jgi:hypothetical protein
MRPRTHAQVVFRIAVVQSGNGPEYDTLCFQPGMRRTTRIVSVARKTFKLVLEHRYSYVFRVSATGGLTSPSVL